MDKFSRVLRTYLFSNTLLKSTIKRFQACRRQVAFRSAHLCQFSLTFLITPDFVSWHFSPFPSLHLFVCHLPTRLDFLCHHWKKLGPKKGSHRNQITLGHAKHFLMTECFNKGKGDPSWEQALHQEGVKQRHLAGCSWGDCTHGSAWVWTRCPSPP